MKRGLDFSGVAETIGLLFTLAYYTGQAMAKNPVLVIAGCCLFLALDKLVERARR